VCCIRGIHRKQSKKEGRKEGRKEGNNPRSTVKEQLESVEITFEPNQIDSTIKETANNWFARPTLTFLNGDLRRLLCSKQLTSQYITVIYDVLVARMCRRRSEAVTGTGTVVIVRKSHLLVDLIVSIGNPRMFRNDVKCCILTDLILNDCHNHQNQTNIL
jgi:hypothetical protein